LRYGDSGGSEETEENGVWGSDVAGDCEKMELKDELNENSEEIGDGGTEYLCNEEDTDAERGSGNDPVSKAR
jgi:hypothetical protein